MARIHSHLDIYVGDDLMYEDTRVVEDLHRKTVVVKARPSNGIGWSNVMKVTDRVTESLPRREGFTWTGILAETGERTVITGVYREPRCCGR